MTCVCVCVCGLQSRHRQALTGLYESATQLTDFVTCTNHTHDSTTSNKFATTTKRQQHFSYLFIMAPQLAASAAVGATAAPSARQKSPQDALNLRSGSLQKLPKFPSSPCVSTGGASSQQRYLEASRRPRQRRETEASRIQSRQERAQES